MREPALFFLDLVEGNEIVGTQLARYIRTHTQNSIIVFVTAYWHKIAYDSESKLLADNHITKTSNLLADELLISIAYAKEHIGKSSIFYRIDFDEIHRIEMEDIIYAETIKRANKIRIRLPHGWFVVRDTMAGLDAKVKNQPYLFRCHESYLVNVNHIVSIQEKNRKILLSDDSVCYYSGAKTKELLSRWKSHG